jgi:hypothetical protein
MTRHIRFSTTLAASLGVVSRVMREQSAEQLRDAGGSHLEIPVGHDTTVRRAVAVDLGLYNEGSDGIRLSVRIAAAEHPALFPTLDGVITASALESGDTEVVLAGKLRTPLGAVGGDRRAAASLAAYFDDFVRRIALAAAEAGPEWRPPLMPPDLRPG